jgi:pimeloyl-ACP methyl ester carboxylesterase
LGQNFARVAGARIRYSHLGTSHSGTPVVFLSGFSGSIEQVDQLQLAIAKHGPTLAYDRAGYGFTKGSNASTALEQANELFGLLKELHISEPVVLVAYSISGTIARVFAGQYPQLTAGLYLIEPNFPEANSRFPNWPSPRRYFLRTVVIDLIWSMIGKTRLKHHLQASNGPSSIVDQRAQAVLARSAHNWAVLREWYFFPVSFRQAMEATVPSSLPIGIAYITPTVENETIREVHRIYATFASRSTRGELHELRGIGHEHLMYSRASVDQLAARIVMFARSADSASRPDALHRAIGERSRPLQPVRPAASPNGNTI